MPKKLPLLQQLGEDFLRQMVEQQPNATLQQYCQMMQQQRGILISPQTMCKLLVRVGAPSSVRRPLAAPPVQSLAA